MRYIGDVHGKMNGYLKAIENAPASIQVGDFGYGFVEIPVLPSGHRQIRGNHDNPALCLESPSWIPDMTVEGDTFFMGGAFSLDWALRKVGIDLWNDEELSYTEMMKAIDIYETARPSIMVTHDCPDEAADIIFRRYGNGSRTSAALQAMFEVHKPDLWIFGHWHESQRKIIKGTEFICLAELETIDL